MYDLLVDIRRWRVKLNPGDIQPVLTPLKIDSNFGETPMRIILTSEKKPANTLIPQLKIILYRLAQFYSLPSVWRNMFEKHWEMRCVTVLFWLYVIIMSRTRFRVNLHTLKLPECQGNPCSKQTQYLKFMWQQRDSNPQSLSS